MKTKQGEHTVRASLEAYASRGVFRGLTVKNDSEFVFTWLTERPMRFRFDSARQTMRFRDLLPNVDADSHLYQDVKAFLEERRSGDLPHHRRIDEKRAEVALTRRNRSVSLALKVKQSEYVKLQADTFADLSVLGQSVLAL